MSESAEIAFSQRKALQILFERGVIDELMSREELQHVADGIPLQSSGYITLSGLNAYCAQFVKTQ